MTAIAAAIGLVVRKTFIQSSVLGLRARDRP
jgi:hypothetical protein